MQRLHFSTKDIPAADRFAYWREEVNETLMGVTGERPSANTAAPFSGEVEAHIGRSLVHFRYRCDNFPVARRAREIARRGWDGWIVLYQERSAGGWLAHGGREIATRPGDLIIIDPALPFTGGPHGGHEHDDWILPRRLIESCLPAKRLPAALQLSGAQGVNAILRHYLNALGQEVGTMDAATAELIAENVSRLVAVACGAAASEHGEAIGVARLEEARRYVGLHLADSRLNPDKVAAALRISVRQLHLLFEPSGISFARYLMQRRLEECRAALLNPLWRDHPITDIAFAWGFNSLGTFYRGFHRQFGMTPNEMRETVSPAAPGA